MPDDIKSLNVILQNPRKGWPTFDALKNKWVYPEAEHINKIEKLMDEKRICLIRGAEGRGKTVLARLVGFKRQEEKGWYVFVIDVPESKSDIDSICNTICSIEDNKTMFIIENAHTSDEVSLKLFETVNKCQKVSFIFTARKIFSDETSDGDIGNPFEEWIENGWYVDLSPDLKTILEIINKFALEKKRDYTPSPEDESWIKKEFGGEMFNLRRLRFYLEAWNDKSDVPLSSIKREDILSNIYKTYIEPLKYSNLQGMLIKVAAVFQFDVNFSGENFDRNLLDGLCDNGVVTFLPGYFYRLQHSTDAAYIVEAEARLKAGKPPDDFTSQILKEYLREKPENYFELLRAVRRNDKKGILSVIFNDDKTYKIISNMVEQDSIKALSTVIGCLFWSCGKEKGLEFWKQYKESYGFSPEEQKKELQNTLNKATLSEIWFLLFFIKKLNIKEGDWLLNEILDADVLIQKAKDTSLSTVTNIIRLTRQSVVGSDKLNAFCEGLDFKGLGERSKDTGLATVTNFLQLTRQAGVKESILQSFCESLDWKILGEAAGKRIDELKNPFFDFHSVRSYSFISKDMATLFVEGIGWSRLNKAINEQFSPDILAAAVKLLTNKCNLKRNELIEKGLDLNPNRIWLNAFVNNPCPRIAPNQQPIQQYYLDYTSTCFVRFAEKEFNKRAAEMPLKSWNILIHNISAACPAGYLEEKITPLLKGLPSKKLEKLICESDLSNIGIFLNRFNSEDGIFEWSIPEDINFKQINFLEKIADSTLEAISHFLFNFYFINRGDCSHYFAEQLDNDYSLLIPKIRDASIAELDFFFWNLWMAMPKGKKPIIFSDKGIMEIISKKLTEEKKDKESILGLFGTLNLSMSSVDESLTNLLSTENAKSICMKAVKEGSIKFIRLLGGCLLLLPKNDLMEIYNEIQKRNFQYNAQPPNQIEALSFIEKALMTSE